MPDTLERALRDVIDASAEPVTAAEVFGLPGAVPRNRPRLPLVLAAAAVVVLAVVGGLILAGQNPSSDDTTPAAPPTLSVPPLSSCVVPPNRIGGCTVTDEQAEVMLGFEINQPDGIPDGWTLVDHAVRQGDDAQPQRAPPAYNRTWYADPGAATGAHCQALTDACIPDYLQVAVRAAAAGEDAAEVSESAPPTTGPDLEPSGPYHRPPVAILDDGTQLYGSLPGGTPITFHVEWYADGRVYRISGSGISRPAVLEIAESLA